MFFSVLLGNSMMSCFITFMDKVGIVEKQAYVLANHRLLIQFELLQPARAATVSKTGFINEFHGLTLNETVGKMVSTPLHVVYT